MKKRKLFSMVLALALILGIIIPAYADEVNVTEADVISGTFTPVTGMEMMGRLSRSINIGDTMEAYNENICPITEMETAWGATRIEQWHFEAIAMMGFDAVRIPIRWDLRMDDNLTINSIWMDRVNEVVDWALAEGLYVIINTHHVRALYDPLHYGPYEEAEQWLLAVWEQIAERFKDYPEQLIFEPMNEPRPGLDGWFWCNDRFAAGITREVRTLAAKVNRLNEAVLSLIRESGGNNDRRVVMLTPVQASPVFIRAHDHPDDPYTMLGVFLYPGDAANQAYERAEIAHIAAALNAGIPIVIKETSPYQMSLEDALAWSEIMYPQLAELGVPVFWWNRYGTDYELFDRAMGEWNYPLLEIFFAAYGATPGESIQPPPVFPFTITTSIQQTDFTLWARGRGNAVPYGILYRADSIVVEFEGRTLSGGYSFSRWEPLPWEHFDRNHPRITEEPGRIIFDLRGTEGHDIGFAVWNEADVRRITRIYLMGENP